MLSLTTKENIILFDQKYYSQIDGVPMVPPLGPTLANIFLCHQETTWLKNCSKSFQSAYYKRYINDIFVLLEKPEQVLRFVNYMNKRHKSINFSSVTEKNNSFSYRWRSQPGIMYRLSNIRKPLADGFPKLIPILSAINTGT